MNLTKKSLLALLALPVAEQCTAAILEVACSDFPNDTFDPDQYCDSCKTNSGVDEYKDENGDTVKYDEATFPEIEWEPVCVCDDAHTTRRGLKTAKKSKGASCDVGRMLCTSKSSKSKSSKSKSSTSFILCDISCVAGSTGVFLINSDGTSTIVPVSKLLPGNKVRGKDASLQVSDQCEVLAVDDWGTGPLFGNYTSDHYNLHVEGTSAVLHGEKGPQVVGSKFTVVTTCPAVQDESGIFFTPLDGYTAPSTNAEGGLSFETYLKFYDLAVEFASSHLIPTAPVHKYLPKNDIDSFEPFLNWKIPNCLHEGKDCLNIGDQYIDVMDESALLATKELLQDNFEVVLPDNIHELKTAYRILYQRRLRLSRKPSTTTN
eukprot:scaffold79760_cov57-Attheya_sp.AAC.1